MAGQCTSARAGASAAKGGVSAEQTVRQNRHARQIARQKQESLMTRISGRAAADLRPITLEPGVSLHAEGSCLAKFGNTHVLCTASVEDRVPHFLRNSGRGWVTAEYGMLPRSTHSRTDREAARGKQGGRTLEIQRLIGRALRSVTDLEALGEHQIKLDCDVIQADGGTRTAAITGAWVALRIACEKMLLAGSVTRQPMADHVAAISCGVWRGLPVADLDYEEDSSAEVDANFVLSGEGGLVEIQGTGEERPFSREELTQMLDLAEAGCRQLFTLQAAAVRAAL